MPMIGMLNRPAPWPNDAAALGVQPALHLQPPPLGRRQVVGADRAQRVRADRQRLGEAEALPLRVDDGHVVGQEPAAVLAQQPQHACRSCRCRCSADSMMPMPSSSRRPSAAASGRARPSTNRSSGSIMLVYTTCGDRASSGPTHDRDRLAELERGSWRRAGPGAPRSGSPCGLVDSVIAARRRGVVPPTSPTRTVMSTSLSADVLRAEELQLRQHDLGPDPHHACHVVAVGQVPGRFRAAEAGHRAAAVGAVRSTSTRTGSRRVSPTAGAKIARSLSTKRTQEQQHQRDRVRTRDRRSPGR